jgi:hypothetical protein
LKFGVTMRIAAELPLVKELSIVVQLEVIFEFVAVQTKELGAGGCAGIGVAVGLLPPPPELPVVGVGLLLPPPLEPPAVAVGLLPPLEPPLAVVVGSVGWPFTPVVLLPAVEEHALNNNATPSTNTKLTHNGL